MAEETEGLKVFKKEQKGQLALTIKVSKDKLALYVDSTIVPTKDKIIIDKDTLILVLKEVVKKDLLNIQALELIASSAMAGKGLQDRKVAQGQAPEQGEDGKLQLLVKAVEIPMQSEDTRFVKDIQRVAPGMVLGIITPPTEGKAGVDVFGEEAKPKPGKPLKVIADKTAAQKPSYDQTGIQYLIAREHGFLVTEKDRIKIQQTLTIKKDVDITSGQVNCNGKVEIGGDVSKGFSVHARDEIQIKGRTHGSTLNSQVGSIKVDGLVLGGPGISVSTPAIFNAYMMQNLRVNTDNDIIIGKDARDSYIETYGCILMKQGHLFGGYVLALGGIEAATIGSDGGSPTTIGTWTRVQVEAEVANLTERLTEHEKLEESLVQKLGPFANPDPEKLPVFEAQLLRKINDLLVKLEDVRVSKQTIDMRIRKMQEALLREPWFQLNFNQILHKGVVIKIGEHQYIVDPYKTGPGTIEYSATTGQFKELPYRELASVKATKRAEKPKQAT